MMIARKNILCSITVLMTTICSVAYGQNVLLLTDTIKDESGGLRYFSLSSATRGRSSVEAKNILFSALNIADNRTDFKLVKTKTGNNGKTSLLYQQLYKNVPVYDGYYYLNFQNNICTSGMGNILP